MGTKSDLERELKRGSTQLLILSILESEARHGYDIAKRIESRSGGELSFHAASLYPILYRMEKQGLLKGRWVEKAGQRRRRYYRLTPKGGEMLASQRRSWKRFVEALDQVTGFQDA
ncbi:MAG TPA: PadR family transcriptional regulator [Acidobacteriota bacterium]|nr:PadR family transcriptional regulator [Acidobacteriota bacterium]